MHIDGPVDLIAEIVSSATESFDRGIKFEAYARCGTAWYWIVDVDAQKVEEYENVSGEFVRTQTVPFNVLFSPRLFPGLTVDLASLV